MYNLKLIVFCDPFLLLDRQHEGHAPLHNEPIWTKNVQFN